ncbi:MAG TPA: hypothetical protein P5087_01005 [Eubacteriales bacterium]|nr:hypothetical protein [Eubacteriales bacterium]
MLAFVFLTDPNMLAAERQKPKLNRLLSWEQRPVLCYCHFAIKQIDK